MGLLRQLRQLDERCVSPFELRRNTQKQKRNVRCVGDVNWVTQANATQSKLAYVDEVLALLEMESYAEAIVGVLGEGLNVEQRKRLTIAVELVAKPELLVFFDEPTRYG